MATNYQFERGQTSLAQTTVRTLLDYFYKPKHRQRFLDIIEERVDKNVPMNRPHARFNGDTLEEIDQDWAHAQNDALGYALWITCKLANAGCYHLRQEDYATCALFPLYFDAIQYWCDADSGHWEEARKEESSSIGVVVGALEQMRQLMQRTPQQRFPYRRMGVDLALVEELIGKGREKLRAWLPYESPPQRLADAALLFLIYPMGVVDVEQGGADPRPRARNAAGGVWHQAVCGRFLLVCRL